MNPASAGGKTGRREDDLRAILKRHLNDFTIYKTQFSGEATGIARELTESGSEAILVAGGDGTINEVVNGMATDDGSAMTRPILGIIPSGSGGDFCRTFDISKPVEVSLERILRNEPVLIDLGRLQTSDGKKRIFANISSTGLSAEIGVNTNRIKWLKKINGTLAFNLTILATTLRHQRVPLSIKTADQSDLKIWDANCVAVCNGQYFGSGVRVAREANPSDGLLDITVVHDLSPLGFLKGVAEIKANDAKTPSGMTKFQSDWIEIAPQDASKKVPIETDGEFAGHLPARFEVIPHAIRLF